MWKENVLWFDSELEPVLDRVAGGADDETEEARLGPRHGLGVAGEARGAARAPPRD